MLERMWEDKRSGSLKYAREVHERKNESEREGEKGRQKGSESEIINQC